MADARRATGLIRQLHAEPRPPLGAESFFRVKTGVAVSHELINSVCEFGNPFALTHEITSTLDDAGHYQEAEELFEDMGIQR
jgi:hypothetical protein